MAKNNRIKYRVSVYHAETGQRVWRNYIRSKYDLMLEMFELGQEFGSEYNVVVAKKDWKVVDGWRDWVDLS